MNDYQVKFVRTYAQGDWAHVSTVEEAKEVGDTLFVFLFIELSDEEGCDNLIEARRRLSSVMEEIAAVHDIL